MPVITFAGENLIAQQQQAGQNLIIDQIVFANIDGLDDTLTPDRGEALPSVENIQLTNPITKDGMLSSNTVVYSTVLTSVQGSFDFNWMGLYSSAHNVLVAVAYVPVQSKIATVGPVIGNVITKNFAIEFNGAADVTGINISAESWQIDYTARLMSMDKIQRDMSKNIYGQSTFLNDAFKIKHATGKYYLAAGKAIIGGLAIEVLQDLEITPGALPQTVWLDVYQETSMLGVVNKFDVVFNDGTLKLDYTNNGVEHSLVRLGVINSSSDIVEQRNYVSSDLTVIKRKEFSGVSEAVAVITANPENYPDNTGIKTLSYKTKSECLAVGIEYPDGAGADYVYSADKTGVEDGIAFIGVGSGQLQLNFVGQYGTKKLSNGATLKVPSDFPNLKSAIDECYKYAGAGKGVTIQLESGYKIEQGFEVVSADLGFVTIQSIDAVVYLDSSFTGVDGGDAFSSNSVMSVKNATAPIWDLLLDCQDTGIDGSSGLVYDFSEGRIGGDKGVINAAGFGLYGQLSSKINATNSNFSGAGYGNRVTVNCFLSAPQANFSGCKNEFYQGSNRAANLDVSRGCLVYVTGTTSKRTNFTGGMGRGLAIRRSVVSATHSDCSNAGVDGLNADLGSTVAFDGSITDDCGLNGVNCSGSFVSFNEQAKAMNNANYNLVANNGGKIIARGVVATGAGYQSVRAAQGSEIIIPGADCRKNITTESTSDIVVSEGSTIKAIGAQGGTNVTPMSFDKSGIIIKETNLIKIATAGGDVSSFIDFEFSEIATASGMVRCFRNTNTSEQVRVIGYAGDGTSALAWQLGSKDQSNIFKNRTVVGDVTPVTSATLAVRGTDGGFLPPTLTTAQRDAITATAGLMIYNTDLNKLQVKTNLAWADLH